MSGTDFSGWEELHRGITVLESSAGTGNTYQITNIALRLITEEKIGISDFLIMTSTRDANDDFTVLATRRLTTAHAACALGIRLATRCVWQRAPPEYYGWRRRPVSNPSQ